MPQGREESERKQDQACYHFNPLKVCQEKGTSHSFLVGILMWAQNSIGNHQVRNTLEFDSKVETHRATRAT